MKNIKTINELEAKIEELQRKNLNVSEMAIQTDETLDGIQDLETEKANLAQQLEKQKNNFTRCFNDLKKAKDEFAIAREVIQNNENETNKLKEEHEIELRQMREENMKAKVTQRASY